MHSDIYGDFIQMNPLRVDERFSYATEHRANYMDLSPTSNSEQFIIDCDLRPSQSLIKVRFDWSE